MAKANYDNLTITVAGVDVTVTHNNFSSLEMNRVVSDAANSFTVSILDDDAFSIEKLLIQGKNDISIAYHNTDNSINKHFVGNIIKMNSSFINNRNMLQLEGYVGISVKDKYQLYSRNWNKVILFDWYAINNGQECSDGIIETFKDSILDRNKLYKDSDGNFYTYARNGDVVRATEVTLPVRPHIILKLLATGGNLSELMEGKTDIEDYKDCSSFYDTISGFNGSPNVNLDFIQRFLAKHSDIVGNGWNYNENNIDSTELVNVNLVQDNQSDIVYINDVLIKNSVQKTEDATEKTSAQYQYGYTFRVDESNNVYYKVISINASQEPKATYTYYGVFNDDGNDNKSRMLSFSANTDILAAFLTGDMSELTKLQGLNLATNEEFDSSILADTETLLEGTEGKYQYSFNGNGYRVVTVPTSEENAKATYLDYWYQAMSQTYKANATIIGNSDLSPGDYIEIIVIPRPGIYHYTSGLYYIIKQKDIIKDGKIQSELELIKNVASMGTTTLKSNDTIQTPMEDLPEEETSDESLKTTYSELQQATGSQYVPLADASGIIF